MLIYVIVCDQFHWGSNCANDCGCGAGAEKCDHVTGCVCTFGWQGTKCDADINECNNLNNPCDTAVNEQCVNTPGSYVCQCVTGYQNVSGTCQGEKIIYDLVLSFSEIIKVRRRLCCHNTFFDKVMTII